MTTRETYVPGPPSAQVHKDGDQWTLVLVRQLHHSPDKVWQALTDPAHLREWAPFEAIRRGRLFNDVELRIIPAQKVT